MPRVAETYTNFGKVVKLPELKLVMMKSSKLRENASSAAAAIPGTSSGNVTFQNASHADAYRSDAASSSLGSRLATRALTVTTTNEMQNMMWAMTTVVNPGCTRRDRNWASSAAPSTTSGVDMGRKMSRFAAERPRNVYRTSAIAMRVPSTVATAVAITPTVSELTSDSHTRGAPHGFFQASSVNPRHTRFERPPSLNENATVYAIGTSR